MPDPTPPSQQVVSALVVQQCLRLVKSRGLSTDALLKGAGISREQLAAPQMPLPFLPLQAQLRQAIEAMDDPLLGLRISALVNLATLGVLGYVMQTSSTLQDLIDTTIRFEGLLSNVGLTWRRAEGHSTLWGWDCYIKDEIVASHAIDCVLGNWASLLTLIKRKTSSPLLGVQLRHAPPKDPRLLREYGEFFRCPVQFNQPVSALQLDAAALPQGLALADPQLHGALAEHAHRLLNRRSIEPVLADQVRGAIRHHLGRGHAPPRDEVAEELGMSGRTLHRKLREAGTSFRDLLDELRLALAQDYLRDSGLTIEAIAAQLGFQESQSFIRWFRQLTGLPPGEFRQQRRPIAT